MSTTPTNPQDPSRARRLSHFFGNRRRRLIAAVVVLLIVAGVALGVTDPFATSGNSGGGISDNAYPTSVATVTEQPLSSQTQVNATLGYEGSLTISIPTGVAPAQLTADRQAVQSAQSKVTADETALSNAEAIATPDNAATLLAAETAVQSDSTALTQAKAQLASDQRLGCPASSSATVTTPSGSSSSPSEGASKKGDLIGGLSAAGSASLPTVTTMGASVTSTTTATLSGTVDPNGSDTSYAFEYGTSDAFGKTTPSQEAGE